MDLVPSADQVASAAANVVRKAVGVGWADLRPMPRVIVDEGPWRRVYRYESAADMAAQGDPVLLVAPLAAPPRGYDLRRGNSLVEELVARGRRTYLVEYGDVALRDRAFGMERWVDDVLPAAVRAVSADTGGRPVHLVGWSIGGLFALLTAADESGLPVASVVTLAAPVDVHEVPLLAPARPLLDLSGAPGPVGRALRAVAGSSTVGWALRLSAVQRLVTDPLAVVVRLDDREFLAQVEAVQQFQEQMTGYPGRSYGQLYHRFLKHNALVTGSIDLAGRTVSLASVQAPVLVVGGTTDQIAPLPAVRAVLPLLTGAREVRLEVVPGGHLGLLTGRGARESTWAALDEWLTEWSGRAPVRESPAKRAPGKKAAASKASAPKPPAVRKAPVKKAPVKKAPAKKAAAVDEAPDTKAAAVDEAQVTKAATVEEIGTNPQRRYGSGGSRSLYR